MLRDEIKQYTQQFLEESNNVLYFLFSIREGIPQNIKLSEEVLFQLMKDRIIKRDYIQSVITLCIPFYDTDDGEVPQYTDFIGETINEVKNRIDEYRILFKPIRPGNMGSRFACIDLMTRFIIENNASFDEVLTATLYYFHNTDPTYIMNAENFIYKVDKEGREVSKLAANLEDIRVEGVGSNSLLN